MNEKSKGKNTAVLAVIVLVTIVILIYINNKSIYERSATSFSKKKLSVVAEMTSQLSKDGQVFFMEDIMLEYINGAIAARDVNGEMVWKYKCDGQIKKLICSGSNIIIIDSNKNLNYLTKQGNLLWQYTLPNDIVDVYTEDNGYFLLEYNNIGGSQVEIFNNKGIKIGSNKFENAYVIAFSVANGEFYTISLICVETDKVQSKLVAFDYKGQMIWAKDYDNQVIPYIKYCKNNNLIAIGEKELYSYKTNGEVSREKRLNNKILRAAANENMTIIIYKDRGKYYCLNYDCYLKEQSRVTLNMLPTGIDIYKDKYILYDKERIDIYGYKGSVVATFKSLMDINSANILSENRISIMSNRKLQVLEYQ